MLYLRVLGATVGVPQVYANRAEADVEFYWEVERSTYNLIGKLLIKVPDSRWLSPLGYEREEFNLELRALEAAFELRGVQARVSKFGNEQFLEFLIVKEEQVEGFISFPVG
jgi:hypothetical protein